ncbi:alkylation response protein AidB-like acyl-CoA dehydrogenase [Herbihabitans rhizosphaerae]|uniref:Alkylation response protein AidB-like acyl-CoA dehydrogenase n=1 Tax=Herbihabitans rhizosphaerae TaxID=1872711 RepID=A0A4Q7L2M5_9PSEU|nr:acyl-CoA dehydrogenase family protein [Herbihabitans rhizosphaerae]RZS43799.1 alkylation response protein AidB-like acyl-CoA dehydrogenase [Herbihabitans rhizosphaerae]
MTDLLRNAETVAEQHLSAIAARGEPGRVNRALVAAIADAGLFGPVFPTVDGAHVPGSAVDLCLLREGLARHCTEAETTLAVQGLGAYPILTDGAPDVVVEWIPRLAAGIAVAGFALTEPDAGSDVAALALAATPDGDGFRLTGEKCFISHAPDADVYSVFARTSENGSRGITAFAVPADSTGLSGKRTRLVAPHAIGRLVFDGVSVPASHVLGEIGGGMRVAMKTLNRFRPSVGAFAVGMAQAALDAAIAHAGTRTAFGRRLHEFQGVSHQLADVATKIAAARLLVRDAAANYDADPSGPTVARTSAMAKLFATETAQHAVDVAIQVHGAKALEEGHPLEHLYREVRAPRIYEGASEVQREIIARELFR